MKRKIAALGGLAALAAVGGTWAYFNQTAAITNPFHTEGGYETSIIEHFNPADGQDWKPGVTVNKDVIASNTGDADVLVRVKMQEVWNRQVGGDLEVLNNFDSSQSEFLTPEQADPVDGKVQGDKTVVDKDINDTDWTLKEDGYWYYNTLLAAKQESKALLSSVTLLSNLDMGKYEDTFAYCTTENENDSLENAAWTEVANEEALIEAGKDAKEAGLYFHVKKGRSLDETAMGYADANYGLEIKIEFVQPTEDAVKDAWGQDGYDNVKDLIPNA